MNSTRIRFGFLVLAVYAVLGVIGVYSQSPAPAASAGVCASDIAELAGVASEADRQHSSSDGGGGGVNVEWHSFLPGAFK